MRSDAKNRLESRMLGNLHVRFGVGVGMKSPGLHHNGKPGIQTRLDRLESSQANRSRLLWLVLGAAATLAVGALWKFIFGGF